MGGTFKEQLNSDLDEIFYNADEFADTILWDGKPVTGIVEDLESKSGDFEGGVIRKTVRVRISEIPVKPEPEDEVMLTLDPGMAGGGEYWRVEEAGIEEGEYVVLFYRNVQ